MEVSEIEVMNFYDTHIENEVIAQKILINPFFAGQHIWLAAMFSPDYHISLKYVRLQSCSAA